MNICNAKIANGYYERKVMDKDVDAMNGEGDTPVSEFLNHNRTDPQYGEQYDFKSFVDYEENLTSVVMKDGKIIFEQYNKEDIDSHFHINPMSMTKTLVGSAVGLALCNGDIKSLDDTVGLYSKSLSNSVYNNVTIRNLLRMASGVNENRDNEKEYNRMIKNRRDSGLNDQVEIIQSIQDRHSEQGKVSIYHTLDVTAASILISELTGKSVSKIFNNEIFTKMGASDSLYWWEDKNGVTIGMAGAYMTTRDWAKFGQFIIDNINQKTCMGDFYLSGINNALPTVQRDYQDYGYYFWVQNVTNSTYESKPMIAFSGKFGHAMILDHYNNSVVLVTSASKNSKYGRKHIRRDITPGMIKEASKIQ
jgi:CubicO group peptidase (beta-lactamase class C family)